MHRALVERVVAGSALKNSPRLQELLHYLCDCALNGSDTPVKEQQIGIAVFGRSPGYDTNQDTIVRVGVSKLRKQLQQHFLSEGLHEPIIVEIPKGAYTPRFQPREEIYHEDHPAAPAVESISWHRLALVLGVLLALSLAFGAWMTWRNLRSPVEKSATSARPYQAHLWKQWLGNGRHTFIVTSDANLLFFSNLMGRTATLAEYRAQAYPFNLFDLYVKDPEVRTLLTRFMRSYLTTTQDGIAAAELSHVTERYKLPATVVYSRDLRLQPQIRENLILLGHRKGNPWVEMFETHMNFVFAWDPETSSGMLLNRSPRQGEKERYRTEDGLTYGTVYCAPEPDGGATVVVLAGSDMTGIEVAAHFMADEDASRKLHEALRIGVNDRIPPFQILLLARRVVNVPYEPELIAWRILSPRASQAVK